MVEMNIDQDLSQFSDMAYRTCVAIYLLALAVSLVYYGMVRIANELRSARATEMAKLRKDAKASSSVGAGASVGASGGGVATLECDGDSIEDSTAGDSTINSDGALGSSDAALEARLPERLQADNVIARVKRADRWGGFTQALVWLGIAVHFLQVVLRGSATHRFPWGNLFEYITMVTLFGMVITAFVIRRKSMRVMWPWILVPVVAVMFYAGTKLYAETAPLVPSLRSYWFVIHVSIVSIGGGIGLVSGIASLMYLFRKSQPKGQEKGIMGAIISPLPAAEKLDALAYRACVWTLPIFGLGIIFGAIWADAAWGRFWGWDPKETVSLVTWILYAAYLHARATPGFRKAAAWINVTAFATMVFNLFFINIVISGLHSYAGLN